jgi:hypothetical protein
MFIMLDAIWASIERVGFVGLQHIRDRKLKGQIVEREKLFGEAAETATKVQEVCSLFPLPLLIGSFWLI